MNENAAASEGGEEGAKVEIEATHCPDCGTEWEVVVTRRAAERERKALAQV